MKETWRQEVESSLYVHRPLPLHPERSLEHGFAAKAVEASQALEGLPAPSPGSPGQVFPEADGFRLEAPLRANAWPEGAPADGDYTNFGQADACFSLDADWTRFNRLAFSVCPAIEGTDIASLNVAIQTDSGDAYAREGETTFNLTCGAWHDCYYEFPELPRARVLRLRFYVLLNGQNFPMGDTLRYSFRALRLERVASPEPSLGWACAPGQIALPFAGYWTAGRKEAIAGGGAGDAFLLEDAETGAAAFEGKVARVQNDLGSFAVLDFSSVRTPGVYRLRTGTLESLPFSLREDLAEESLWKALNFLHTERCGTLVPGRHTSCHLDSLAHHGGVALSYAGGWHDAGDVSQQTVQTGEIVHGLLEAAARCAPDSPLRARLLEEAQWGLEFVLRTRFGDGYRATSAGATRWTDGMIGNMDDIAVRVHGHAFENFILAGIEAFAAHTLQADFPGMASGSLRAATQDFDFAMDRYRTHGMELPSFYEHTYQSSHSQYLAVISWSASCLYQATGLARYAAIAADYGTRLLACQETAQSPSGYFYRDETRRAIVHFTHQSREQLFMQALVLLCQTQPAHADRPQWEAAMRLYAGYLRALMPHTAPYGMLPAGIYRYDEVYDRDTFALLHLLVDYDAEMDNYHAQLQSGVPVDAAHVIRRFPVWFSFRGNTAIHLAMGKAAAALGHYFDDEALLDIGREQLYWLLGKNPFAQSLQYGMGQRYPSQYAIFPGEAAGSVPVGIQTKDNGDAPFWPQANNATYKEVWTSAVSRLIWLMAEYLEGSDAP